MRDGGAGTAADRGPGGVPELRLSVPATNAGVRSAIERVLALAAPGTAGRDALDHLEIALAEILNNIVEHAYAGGGDGRIDIALSVAPPGLHFEIVDDGRAMPAGRLPGGAGADPARGGHEQAEGGYGLLLIRQLARKLRYERVGDRNRLTFRLPLGPG